MSRKKIALDLLVVKRGLAADRNAAQRLILSGKIYTTNSLLDKPGVSVAEDLEIFIEEPEHPYVSRGGVKLAYALDTWRINPTGWICGDFGASTGGFTDCLLQRGVSRVYAYDVGRGLIHWKLRQDSRVILREGINIRHLKTFDIPEPLDLLAIDLSFISLVRIWPIARLFLKAEGIIVALVKPQFEVPKGRVGKGGIVRCPSDRRLVLERHFESCRENQLAVVDIQRSPIPGTEGNLEYLSLIVLPDECRNWRNRLNLSVDDHLSVSRIEQLAEESVGP
mgnify:CR=1 FL=1